MEIVDKRVNCTIAFDKLFPGDVFENEYHVIFMKLPEELTSNKYNAIRLDTNCWGCFFEKDEMVTECKCVLTLKDDRDEN